MCLIFKNGGTLESSGRKSQGCLIAIDSISSHLQDSKGEVKGEETPPTYDRSNPAIECILNNLDIYTKQVSYEEEVHDIYKAFQLSSFIENRQFEIKNSFVFGTFSDERKGVTTIISKYIIDFKPPTIKPKGNQLQLSNISEQNKQSKDSQNSSKRLTSRVSSTTRSSKSILSCRYESKQEAILWKQKKKSILVKDKGIKFKNCQSKSSRLNFPRMR